MQVDQTLVDAHLEAIPSVCTLTTGGFTGGDAQDLGGETDGSRNVQVLVDGTLLQVSADLFEVGDIARSQSNADAVDNLLLGGGGVLLDRGNVRHD